MDKYLIISSNDLEANIFDDQADTIQEAREKIRELCDSPSNYYPRGIYKLVETHELSRDVKVTPCDSPEDAPKGASSTDTTEDESISLIELINKDMPEVTAMGHGCPCDDKFSHIFEKYGYVQPETYDCFGITCDECWSCTAVKKPEKPLTRLEVVHKTMPGIEYAGDGCPWCMPRFQEAFESQGYKFPGYKAFCECPKFTCKECWNEPAERLIPTDGE